MNSTTPKPKLALGLVIVYRRVSTKKQVQGEYKSQLAAIKSAYPGFKLTDQKNLDLKEVISGLAKMEKRVAGKLGTGLRALIQNPSAIMIVSSADRIARCAEVFLRIQDQGLGSRIYDASTGKNVDEIIAGGEHLLIERRTKAQRQSRRDGMKRYVQSGGTIGNHEIKSHTQKAAKKRRGDAEEKRNDVLSAVSAVANRNRGSKPSLQQVCDELDEREVRTGQGYFFVPEKLSQLKKGIKCRWEFAEDSYSRHRRRIRSLVRSAPEELRNRRRAQILRARLDALTTIKMLAHSFREACTTALFSLETTPNPFEHKQLGNDGCRGPPSSYGEYQNFGNAPGRHLALAAPTGMRF